MGRSDARRHSNPRDLITGESTRSPRQLPDGTYRDVLRIIRSLNKDVPLVVTSRLADWDEYFEVLQHGAFDLIASPCQPKDVSWVTLRAQRDVSTHLARKRGA